MNQKQLHNIICRFLNHQEHQSHVGHFKENIKQTIKTEKPIEK
ncbi:hypothetical protein VIMY103929_11045 [Vibrio mytili]